MLSLKVESVVAEFTPLLLKEGWSAWTDPRKPRNAVIYEFDCRFNPHFDETEETLYHKVCKRLYICVTERREVFYAITEFADRKPTPDDWIFTSAHESCWKDMRFIFNFYIENCKLAAPDLAPADVEVDCYLWRTEFRQVVVKMVDDHSYNRRIVAYAQSSESKETA